MRISLFQKILAALLLSCSLIVVTMATFTNASFKEGFQRYLNQEELVKAEDLASKVVSYYSNDHGWRRLEQAPHIWAGLLQQIGELPPPKRPIHEQQTPRPKASIMMPMSMRVTLLDRAKKRILGPEERELNAHLSQQLVEIKRSEQVVGYIRILQSNALSNHLAEHFLASQLQNITKISLITIVLSLLFSFVSARYLVTPLRALHKGANAVSHGDLGYQISHTSNDEIDDVTKAFNQLVSSLKQQELLREQWLSDISHELRTPLAVLQAELEALEDGIRKPDPSYIHSLHQQVLTLAQLVEDLRAATKTDVQLNLSLTKVNLNEITLNTIESHRTRFEEKALAISYQAPPKNMHVQGDANKLTQVLNNLLENSYRYTDQGGEVVMKLSQIEGKVRFILEDSSPGVPAESLNKLCERLYRVDASRSRAFGGSGLGLAICKNIIEAHNGELHVEHSSLGGVKVVFTLTME